MTSDIAKSYLSHRSLSARDRNGLFPNESFKMNDSFPGVVDDTLIEVHGFVPLVKDSPHSSSARLGFDRSYMNSPCNPSIKADTGIFNAKCIIGTLRIGI
jgi:hypothetical protein